MKEQKSKFPTLHHHHSKFKISYKKGEKDYTVSASSKGVFDRLKPFFSIIYVPLLLQSYRDCVTSFFVKNQYNKVMYKKCITKTYTNGITNSDKRTTYTKILIPILLCN